MTPVPTSAPFVRLGVGPAPASPTGIEDPARKGNGSPSPPPPPGLEKPNETAHFHIGSPATSHAPPSSSMTPPRSTKSTPPPVPGLARAAQTTPPPLARIDHPSPQVIFQGNDHAGWFAVLQAQWQVCDSYRLAGQVQLEAQQREYAMLLQHQFESMFADLKSNGDTHTLKVDYEQQLADLRRRAEVSHAEQGSASRRQRAEAEKYILDQRAAYDAEQRQREEQWKTEKAQAEAIFAEEKRRSAADAEAQAEAIRQEKARLAELDRQ